MRERHTPPASVGTLACMSTAAAVVRTVSPMRKPVDLLAPTGRLTRMPDDDALLRLAIWLADVAEEAAVGSAHEPAATGPVS